MESRGEREASPATITYFATTRRWGKIENPSFAPTIVRSRPTDAKGSKSPSQNHWLTLHTLAVLIALVAGCSVPKRQKKKKNVRSSTQKPPSFSPPVGDTLPTPRREANSDRGSDDVLLVCEFKGVTECQSGQCHLFHPCHQHCLPPKGCMFGPLLYTSPTHDCSASSSSYLTPYRWVCRQHHSFLGFHCHLTIRWTHRNEVQQTPAPKHPVDLCRNGPINHRPLFDGSPKALRDLE